jgi:hypothetical protein
MPDESLTSAASALGETSVGHMEHLRAEARYARQRYQLYKAKATGQRPTSPERLRELQRTHEQTEARLAAAEAEEQRAAARPSRPGPG